MTRLVLSMFTYPLMALCGVALMAGIFLAGEGFKSTPQDIGTGLRGLGLILLSVVCFPSRSHLLFRIWQNRQTASRLPDPAPRTASARPDALPRPDQRPRMDNPGQPDRTASPATLHDGRVRLDLLLPPDTPSRVTSWFGGLPRLPGTVDWPMAEDGPMLFVAQIAMADLPRDIWGGLGPRTGSLAFFVDASDDFRNVAVLHIDGPLTERRYPAPLEVIQSYPVLRRSIGGGLLAAPPEDDALPLMPWPVRATPIDADAELPHPAQKHRAPDTLAQAHRRSLTLADPAFRPYDWSTLIQLLTSLIIEMNRHTGDIAKSAEMKEALDQTRDERAAAARTLTALRTDARRRRRRGDTFTPQVLDDTLAQLDGLQVRLPRHARDPATGQVRATVSAPMPVLACLHAERYYAAFEYLARDLYARAPDLLPAAVRESFEPVWRQDAMYEVGAMGGQIDLAAYVTAPRRDLVCLLDVPRSELVGTEWHDLSSLGFFIDPHSLADMRFERAIGLLSE